MCKDRRVEFIIHSERMQLGFFFLLTFSNLALTYCHMQSWFMQNTLHFV